MTIRKSGIKDTNTQRALEDVEQELARIKTIPRPKPDNTEMQALRQEVTLLRTQMNQLSLFRYAEGAIADVKTGNPLRVLHETGEWKEVTDGLIKAVPKAITGVNAGRVVQIQGSVAIAPGSLSAETLRSRKIIASGVINANGGVDFSDIDPGVSGVWWDNAGTLTKSAG